MTSLEASEKDTDAITERHSYADYIVVSSSSISSINVHEYRGIDADKSVQCDCISSPIFPHRKFRCLKEKIYNNLAPGLFVRNECDRPILVVLSQLTPLHWVVIKGNDSAHISCGRVFFTVSTGKSTFMFTYSCAHSLLNLEFYNEATVPTQSEVALRISAITVSSVLTCGVIGIGVVGALSAITSQKGAKIDGVLADGCCVVIHGKLNEVGTIIPAIKSVEYLD